MKHVAIWAALIATTAAIAVPALAVNDSPGQKLTSSTTLDACGYFVGTQTANKTTNSGSTYTEKGTWTGVSNNYGGGPVTSLGPVQGSYTMTQDGSYADGAGIVSGSEVFHSDAGTITQSYSYDASSGWHVSVTATGNRSFLTSDTDGHCYTGAFPRP